MLPEHLWIASLANEYSLEDAHKPFEEFLDALDTVWHDPDDPPIGILSDFALVSPEKRSAFRDNHKELIRRDFLKPIGRILAFYPENPAAWLIDEEFLREGGSLDPEVELRRLRQIVGQLLPAKDKAAGHLRVLPSTRLAKHGRLSFVRGKFDDLIDMLIRYPGGCNEEEQYHVQSFARITVNTVLNRRATDHRWAKYFWRHNYDLAACKPRMFSLHQGEPITEEQGNKLSVLLRTNSDRARNYLDLLSRTVRCDLYAPERDEIMLGLIARVIRLYVLTCSDPNLWARDTAGIMLRCLGDTAITFAYLARCGSNEDFERFKSYGEGQQKLLMLHLQDTYPDEKSLEGRSATELGDELGSFMPELLPIELGNWSKKDSHKLATEAGMERFYRLIFTPTSGDVHGTWFSLKNSNLQRCGEILHRFHRLPAFAEPPMFANTVFAAQEIVEECFNIATTILSYPAPAQPLERFVEKPKDPGGDSSE